MNDLHKKLNSNKKTHVFGVGYLWSVIQSINYFFQFALVMNYRQNYRN